MMTEMRNAFRDAELLVRSDAQSKVSSSSLGLSHTTFRATKAVHMVFCLVSFIQLSNFSSGIHWGVAPLYINVTGIERPKLPQMSKGK